MRVPIPAILIFCFFTFSPVILYGQTCNCDSLVQARRSDWPNWVRNSDTIRIIQVVNKGPVKTASNKQKILELLVADSAWIAFPESGKRATVQFGRFDSLAGRQFRLPVRPEDIDSTRGKPFVLPGDPGPMRNVSFASKSSQYEFFNERITTESEYFEVYFKIGEKIVMSPGVCLKYKCVFMDNIIFDLIITK